MHVYRSDDYVIIKTNAVHDAEIILIKCNYLIKVSHGKLIFTNMLLLRNTTDRLKYSEIDNFMWFSYN